MMTLVALTFGLVVWILLWATGAKPFDAFLVTIVIVLPVAAWQIFGSGIKKMLGQGQTPPPS
jgi:hypothetical protein